MSNSSLYCWLVQCTWSGVGHPVGLHRQPVLPCTALLLEPSGKSCGDVGQAKHTDRRAADGVGRRGEGGVHHLLHLVSILALYGNGI